MILYDVDISGPLAIVGLFCWLVVLGLAISGRQQCNCGRNSLHTVGIDIAFIYPQFCSITGRKICKGTHTRQENPVRRTSTVVHTKGPRLRTVKASAGDPDLMHALSTADFRLDSAINHHA